MSYPLYLYICYTPVGYKQWRKNGSDPNHPVAQELRGKNTAEEESDGYIESVSDSLAIYICQTPVGYKEWKENGSDPESPVGIECKKRVERVERLRKRKSKRAFSDYVTGNKALPQDDQAAIRILRASLIEDEPTKTGETNLSSGTVKVAGMSISLGFGILMLLLGPDSSSSRRALHEFKTLSKACRAFASSVTPLKDTFKLLQKSQTGRVLSAFEYGMIKVSHSKHPELTDQEREDQLFLAWSTFEDVYNTLHDVPHLLPVRYEAVKAIALIHLAMGHQKVCLEWLEVARKLTHEMQKLSYHKETHVVDSYHKDVRHYCSTHRSGLYGLLRTGFILLEHHIGEKKREEIMAYNDRILSIRNEGARKRKEVLTLIASIR